MLPRRMWMGAGLVVGLLGAVAGAKEPPKVEKVDGHLSPVSVEVTFRKPDSPKKAGLLTGTSRLRNGDLYVTHWLKFTEDGNAGGLLWLDSLALINDTSDEDASVEFKDGSKRKVRFGEAGHRFLILQTSDGGRETIDLEQVEAVRFLKPARHDSDKNAMFDHWRYSPFTGEKLSPVKPMGERASTGKNTD